MTNFPILSSLILIPTIGSIFLLFIKSTEKNNSIKYVINFFLSLYLWKLFDNNISDFQFVETRIWIKNFINYKVGVDGISMLFIILATFITPLCIISVNNHVKIRLKE